MTEKIELNGETYEMRWTIRAEQLFVNVKDFAKLDMITQWAILGMCAIHGANYRRTITVDDIVDKMDDDLGKLRELGEKAASLRLAFMKANEAFFEGNVKAPEMKSEGAKN